MKNRSAYAVLTRFGIIAAVLATLVLIAPAASAATVKYSVPENSTETIAQFSATDAEDDDIEWSTGGDDGGKFKADGGVLTWKKAPNFESPGDTDKNNVYKVSVIAASGLQSSSQAVEVKVTNVEEPGTVEFDELQPQVGNVITATLSDPDVVKLGKKWQWSRSADKETWTDIEKAAAATYTPASADEGSYLRATVTYKDGMGSENDTAMAVTDSAVVVRPTSNAAPSFPDQDPSTTKKDTVAVRTVAENSGKGTAVGEPVVASDPNNDAVLYSLSSLTSAEQTTLDEVTGTDGVQVTLPGESSPTTLIVANAITSAADNFTVKPKTGQIVVEKKDALDFDSYADAVKNKNIYAVKLTARDPSGATGSVTVVIKVTDVNEAPKIDDEETGSRTNRTELEINENVKGNFRADTNDNGSIGEGDESAGPVGYTAKDTDTRDSGGTDDDDTQKLTWTVAGDDGGKFTITTTGDSGRGVLSWKSAPDFESPGDKNKDNVYDISIVATDAGLAAGKVAVKVTVKNVEETGALKLSQLKPIVGISLFADAADDSGEVDKDIVQNNPLPTWEWYSGAASQVVVTRSSVGDGADSTAPTLTTLCSTVSTTDTNNNRTNTTCKIDGATGASYTPVAADVGAVLYAVLKYKDGHDDDDAGTANADEALEYVQVASANAVGAVPNANTAPAFDEDPGKPGNQNSEAVRSVDENDKGASVGRPVIATDGDNDPLLYSLSGTDAGSFKIDRISGQIATTKKLDYESLPEDAKYHMVTVTATDPAGSFASIPVKINVNDVNDAPAIAAVDDKSFDHPENSTDSIAQFSAMDADEDDITWSTGGDDGGKFNITGGLLTWKKAPNFESPGDVDKNNVYKVSVIAASGLQSSSQAVEVTVKNVEEPGTVEFDELQPQVGNVITATLSDPDVVKLGKKWQWSRSADKETWTDIEKAAAATYTPASADEGSYLRATVTYKDGMGSENDTAMAVTDSAVVVRPTSNAAPSFPDQDPSTTKKDKVAMRTVAENSGKGTAVGEPVVASDPNNDAVLYSLSAVTSAELTGTFGLSSPDGITVANANDNFTVKPKTGQIVVEKKDALDFETAAKKKYAVKLTARDPSGANSAVAVVIDVTDVNEAPKIDAYADSGATNPRVLEINENGKTAFFFDSDNDGDFDSSDSGSGSVKFTAKDTDTRAEDGTDDDDTQKLTWTVAGDDGGKFTITTTGTTGRGVLSWKSAPNFESPGDKNKDNVYDISIVATDAGLAAGKLAVKIKVRNLEETGDLKLSQLKPIVGISLFADAADDSGEIDKDIVKNNPLPTWQWYRGGSTSDADDLRGTDGSADGSATTLASGLGDCTPTAPTGDTVCKIDGATGASYTPVALDVNTTLYAVVKYEDGHALSTQTTAAAKAEYVIEASANAVGAVPNANTAPAFDEDPGKPGNQNSEAVRSVDENDKGASVGRPVIATDGDNDPLLYSLSGTDAGSFKINRLSGQITTTKKLDYESLPEDAKYHMVTVTATDPVGSSASIPVKVNVNDVNDAPSITVVTDVAPAPDPAGPDCMSAAGNVSALAADCQTLLDIMDELVGDDGTAELNWSVDTPMSEWQGVSGTGSGRVTHIYLRAAGLAGVLPSGITALNGLESLTLTDNDLSGDIPDLNGLDSIKVLVLGGNAFTGAIPASLGDLDSLLRLWLHRNDGGFEGGIPAELGNLSNIRYLMLYGNDIVGGIPASLANATNLKALYLHDNMLSGPIPASLGSIMTDADDTLRLLYLHNNMLSGDVPAELGNLTSLTRVLLSGNSLTGCIPAAIIDAADDADRAGLSACVAAEDDGNGNGSDDGSNGNGNGNGDGS